MMPGAGRGLEKKIPDHRRWYIFFHKPRHFDYEAWERKKRASAAKASPAHHFGTAQNLRGGDMTEPEPSEPTTAAELERLFAQLVKNLRVVAGQMTKAASADFVGRAFLMAGISILEDAGADVAPYLRRIATRVEAVSEALGRRAN